MSNRVVRRRGLVSASSGSQWAAREAWSRGAEDDNPQQHWNRNVRDDGEDSVKVVCQYASG